MPAVAAAAARIASARPHKAQGLPGRAFSVSKSARGEHVSKDGDCQLEF